MLKDLLINHLAPGEIDRTGERVDGKATIIGKLGYNWIAVLDAAYRANSLPFGKFEINLPGLQDPGLGGIFLNSTTTPAGILTQGTIDPNSSKVNTAYLETQNSGRDDSPSGIIGVPAAAHCFNIQIAGTTAQLGNIQTMAFVCLRKDFIDANDPTVESNLDKSLLRGISNIYMSSSAYAKTKVNVWAINSDTNQTTSIARRNSHNYIITIPILEIPAYEDRTGERIDGKATIIGRLGENWIAVLDAAYRGTAQYSVNTKMEITGGLPYTSGDYTVTATSTENYILAQTLYDSHSSKWNTCYLNQVQTATSFPAAKMCYDINVGGNHAQLPNAQALAFVYSKKDYIDAKDPTASTNPDKKLSNWGFGSSSGYLAASTNGAGLAYCVAMNASGKLHSSFSSYRTGVYGVCPILEIPLYKDRTGERVDGKATIAGKLGNYWIAVLDATFRAFNKKFGKYETNFSLPSVAYDYFITSDMTNEAAFLTQKIVDPNTSKFNTDYFKTQNTGTDQYGTIGVPAAAHCFGIQINGQNAQLGNIQSTAFVFANRSFVDANDPTAETNPRFKLSNWSFDSTLSTRVFSSTKSGSQAQQAVDKSGQIYQTTKNNYSGVVPILEIPLWCDDDYK